MPLLAGDIRFARSANMADVPEGGGPPSAQLLTSGRSNEVFPDVSEETRTVGRVEIYQIHGLLRNLDRDPLLGANVIIAEPPADPNVSITMLSLKDPFATRAQIARRIESGMSAGSEWSGYLLENHYATMRSIQLLQRPGMPAPGIGKTFVLVYQEGLSGERRQRVRIKSTETVTRTFTEVVNGQLVDFEAQVTTCEIFDGLLFDFPGSPPTRMFARGTDKTRTRETIYSDSGMFYGATRLTVASQISDSWLQLTSIYTQIVPNSRTEAAMVDQRPTARHTIVLASAPRRVEVGITPHTQRIKVFEENAGLIYVFQCRPMPEPGTVFIDYWALGQRYIITDDGEGRLVGQGGGAVDYLTGAINVTLKAIPDIGSFIGLTHGAREAYTNRSAAGASVRPPEYTLNIDGRQERDRIVAGTLQIQYTSGGVLRTITDDALGTLTGDGTGAVEYLTRAALIRPTYMPDPGAEFLISCSRELMVQEIIAPPGAPDAGGFINFALSQQPVPGTLQLIWVTARQVSNTSGSTLTTTSAAKDSVGLWLELRSPFATEPAHYNGVAGVYWASAANNSLASWKKLDTASLASKSEVSGRTADNRIVIEHTATDSGTGVFYPTGTGVVDYVGKSVTIKVVSHDRTTQTYQSDHEDASSFEVSMGNSTGNPGLANSTKGGVYGTASVGEELFAGASIVACYSVGTAAPEAHTQTLTPPPVVLDLCPYTTHRIVPGSVQYRWMGTTYVDFEGVLYRGRTDVAPGIASGTIDYDLGIASMYDYVVGGTGPADFQLQSLWTTAGQWSTASIFFNTEAAPLRPGPGGFVLTVVDLKGQTLTANVLATGEINGPHMRGRIEFSRGAVELQFGDFVLDADLTDAQKAEWWYAPADVGAVQPGKIWRPWPVDPTTLRYSAVSYIYLPVDVSLMGIDPAALPADGRVPFARPGDTCVVGVTHSGPAFAASVGQTYSVGHERLSFVQVLDSVTGEEIRTGYTHDLDAGTLTFTDLAGYPAQVKVVARTEVYRQIAEVRIDGKVRLTQPIGYAFPVDAVFSTALRQGDRFARVTRVYDQASWNKVKWTDGIDPTVGEAPATYNTTGSPIEVTNRGAITERWALHFKTSTTFDLYGQHLGLIASGSINEDFAPHNTAAGVPYFTLRALGWGGGWAAGNAVFVDTVGAEAPIDLVRTVQPSSPAGIDDSFWLVQRGDEGRPPEYTP